MICAIRYSFIYFQISVYHAAEPVLEENPKWTALVEVMKEIQLEIASQGSEDFPTSKTLIVAEDDRTCLQLRKILEMGSREFLQSLFFKSKTENAEKPYK